jgi:hypothetical protein
MHYHAPSNGTIHQGLSLLHYKFTHGHTLWRFSFGEQDTPEPMSMGVLHTRRISPRYNCESSTPSGLEYLSWPIHIWHFTNKVCTLINVFPGVQLRPLSTPTPHRLPMPRPRSSLLSCRFYCLDRAHRTRLASGAVHQSSRLRLPVTAVHQPSHLCPPAAPLNLTANLNQGHELSTCGGGSRAAPALGGTTRSFSSCSGPWRPRPTRSGSSPPVFGNRGKRATREVWGFSESEGFIGKVPSQ